jgi:hypothetical protein
MYRALTVAKEYANCGDRNAALPGERPGWKLRDSALVEEIARARLVQKDFGRNWRDPHLDDLPIDSRIGGERAVSTIPAGMGNPS